MLQKTVVNIPLTGGLDTKTAPNLVHNDKMALIQNARFIQGANGAKQKRNGYLQLGQRDSSGNSVLNGTSLATYNNQMLAFDGLGHAFTAANGGSVLSGIGETVGAFPQSGLFNNFAISEVAIAKDLTSYSSPDSATCNGVTAYAYLSGTTINVRIVEEATGIIYYTQVFPGTFSSPRVVTDGTYLYVFSVSSVGLQSIKITPTTPQNTLALVTVDASATGTACEVCYIPSQGYFAVAYQIGVTSSINLKMSIVSSIFAIVSSTSPTLTVSFTIGAIAISLQSSTGSTINVCVAFSPAKVGVTSTVISVYWLSVTAGAVSNGSDAFYGSTIDALIPCITLVSGGGSNPISVFWQLEAQPDGTLRQIQYATTIPSSSAISPQLLIRNTAIAAAGFVQGGQMYLPVVFESTTQQNYFLLQVTGGTAEVVSGAFMPDDAGSFPTGGVLSMPVPLAAGKWSVALPKYTQLESVGGAIQYVTGIVELVMDFTQTRVQGVQLGQSLVMTGPLVREFDGETIVEQGFCNYPDSVIPVLLNDYGLGVATVLGTNTPTAGVINISFPSINNGSADTNLGSGQKFDGQLFIPPSTTNGYGTYFLLSSTPNTNNLGFYAVWFNVIGQGLVDPTTTGGPLAGGIWNPIPVTINATDSTATIVQNTYQAISGSAFGVALLGAGGTITQAANLITITAPNVVNETALIQPTWRSQFSIYNLLMQESGDTQIGKTPTFVKLPPGNVIVPGSYFINNGYVFWFSVDGVGTAPVGTGLTTVQVSIASTDPENTVAFHFWQAILPLGGYVTNSNPYPYLIIFWTQDAASIGYGTMLSSGIGISDGSGTPGAYATDAYQYSSIYERIDTAGQLHRSEPAVPVTIGIPSWGGGGQNSFYAVALVVPNLQLTNTGGIGIIGYRTTTNSTLLFRFTPVNSITMSAKTADSTILYDHTTDAALNGNELLYTTGGIFGNDQAPPLSFLCVHQDRMWGISDEDPTLLYFTKQFSGGLEVAWSLEQTVRIDPSGGYAVSMASMDGNLIVFAQTRIWVISGAGPDDAGNGAFNLPQLVSSAVGCRDPFSVVLTPDGLIFKSSKGFYLLDRSLNAEEMPAEEAFNSDVVTAATLIPNTTEIRFLSSSGTTQLYDYFYKEWGSFTNHQGLDACIWNGVYCYLRTPSTVSTPISIFQENPQPVNVLPTDNGVAFPMVLTLNWIKGADIAATAGNAAAAVQSFGRIWKSLWKGNFQGIMQVTNAYDYANSPQPSDSHLIGGVGSGSWGSDPTWGSSTPWGGSGSTTAFYQFKCYNRNQLCEAIQLTIQDVAPYCYWSLDALALEVGIRKGAYKRLGVGQST